jgi:hypothetical protein
VDTPQEPTQAKALQSQFETDNQYPMTRTSALRGRERYWFGATLADVYSNPPELTPVVQMRMVKGYLAVGDVLHVLPTDEGGLHVDHVNGSCEIGKTGDLAYVYTAPQPETMLRASLEVRYEKMCMEEVIPKVAWR